VAALCAVAVGFGAYAAMGDGAGPAALGGQIGIAASGGPNGDAVAEGAPEAGDVDGTPVTEPPAADAPPGTQPPATQPPGTPQPSQPPVATEPPARDPSDPMSPAYNPYTTPGDPAFVTEAARMAWLGRQAVIRDCMGQAGFEYLEWQWWEGGTPMPAGLGAAAEAAWMAALRGDAPADAPQAAPSAETPSPTAEPGPDATPAPEPSPGPDQTPTAQPRPAGGCEQVAADAAAAAEAAGSPLTAPLPPRDPSAPTERERWLAFQDAVRACMAGVGQPYNYWEFWNPQYSLQNGSPAMPAGLTDQQRAAWNTAAFGSPDANASEQPLDGGGCWTTGANAVDYREFQ
jgi:hypothetical protein